MSIILMTATSISYTLGFRISYKFADMRYLVFK